MSALITADWHLANNPRDEYRFHFVERLLPKLIKKHNVELLLFLGDVCEEKCGHPAELVNRVVVAFHKLSKLCPVICLRGNHDWLSNPNSPYFGFLSLLKGVSWVNAPTPLATVKNVPVALSKASKALLLPHSANPDRDWAGIDFREYDWAFAHQSFAGARSESGFQLGGVPLSRFPKKLRIIAGDIHKPQDWGQLTYVGSPTTIDFGESFEPRVLLWDGKTVTSVPCPGPQKRLITLSGENPSAALHMEHPLFEIVAPINKGDIVKVRVEIASCDDWPAFKKELEAWALKKGVVLHATQPLIQNAVSVKGPLDQTVKTDEELFHEYGKKRQLNDGYLKVGEKLL